MKTIFLFLMCSVSVMAYSQNPEKKITELEWTISFKKNHIIFECYKGCNYSYLSFDDHREVVLNENTMANLEKNPNEQNSDFLIKYSKNGDTINLQALKGVEWKNITLTKNLDSKYYINQSGEITSAY